MPFSHRSLLLMAYIIMQNTAKNMTVSPFDYTVQAQETDTMSSHFCDMRIRRG